MGAGRGLLCLAVTRIGGSCALSDGLTAVGGVCAWAFTHESDNITAIDAKKSDSIAAPEPDDGPLTDHPHHVTVSMMLSIKVHTKWCSHAAMRGKRNAAAERLEARSRQSLSAAGSVPAYRPDCPTNPLFIVNI